MGAAFCCPFLFAQRLGRPPNGGLDAFNDMDFAVKQTLTKRNSLP
jgi:hypothetical protein